MGRVNQVHAVMVGGMAGRYIGQSVLTVEARTYTILSVLLTLDGYIR